MVSRRINPELSFWNINDIVIPPPKDYQYFQEAIQYPFNSDVIEHSVVNAWWLAEFATLAYESRAKVDDEVNKLGSSRFVWLNEDIQTHTDGFFVEFETFVVVAFRGTELPKISQLSESTRISSFLGDLATDANVINDAEIKGVKVHKGINNALNQVWCKLYKLLESTCKQVWFTGHSLGGALAIMSAFKWGNNIRLGGVYTIGGPAIGSYLFKQKYDQELSSKTFRYIYGSDFVTDIEELAEYISMITNFEHVGQAKYLSRVDIEFPENLVPNFLMKLIDHGPIFYLNALWNQMIEQQ